MVGQMFSFEIVCDRLVVVLRWVKVVVGVGLVRLLVGIQMVWIEVIELFLVEVMCFCIVFMLVVSVGWQFMVEGIWFSRVDIFELVCVKWKMLFMKNRMLVFEVLWNCLVSVRLVSVMCICVFGGLFIWLQISVIFDFGRLLGMIMFDFIIL